MFKKIVALFLFIGIYFNIQAQTTPVLDNLRPSIKWYQLKTPHFRIIYPQGFSEQGQRMANTMEHIYAPAAKSLGVKPRNNFPIILQNQNSRANGFVTLGPRRSEFFTMSPQSANFLGNNDWLNLLALHEYRHIVQFEKSRTGFTGFVRNIFGEFSQAALASTSVPSWFWEGDAVDIETSLSPSGRGRIPEFSAVFRANLLEKGPFNYNKQYLRSFKDFIPNHYVLGYHYSTYLKTEYGLDAMSKMVNKAWALPFIPFTFSFAQKKYGGKKMPKMYLAMMAQLENKWRQQLASITITPFELVNTAEKKIYTNYNYPQVLDNGNILVLKSGIGDIEQLVEIDQYTGEEEVRFVPGIINDAGLLSAQGNLVVWNENTFHPRWRQQTSSVIRTYNIATEQYTELTKDSRYSSAALSPDRVFIATIEQTEDYKNRLIVIDAYSGSVNYTVAAADGAAFLTPVWYGNKKIIVAEVSNGRKSILEIDFLTGTEEVLFGPTEEQISFAFRDDDYLYYVSGITGIDNIYAKNLTTNDIFQITSSKYGAYNPVIAKDESTLYYNNISELGNDVVKINLNPSSWTPIESLPETAIKYYQPIVELEGNPDILQTVPEKVYEESRYHKKLIKLHSWGPFLTSSANDIEVGLYSTNVLSTTDVFAGFRIDTDANINWLGRVSYQTLYPIIDVELNYARRNASANYRDTTDIIQTDQQTWQETGVKAGLRVPLLLTRNRFHTSFTVQNYVGLTAVKDFQSDDFGPNRISFTRLNDGELYSNEFKATFSSLQKRSKRDVQTRLGWVFIYEFFNTPYGGDFKGALTAIKTQLYLPGFFRHHSFNVFGGYQHNNITLNDNNYWFANRMPYPRGVSGTTLEDFYTVRVNYEMPLLYPDLSIGPWLYLQRIKTNLFSDYGAGSIDVTNFELQRQLEINEVYNSIGAELTFDFNFMRALPVLELGVRYSYWLNSPDEILPYSFELLIGSFGF